MTAHHLFPRGINRIVQSRGGSTEKSTLKLEAQSVFFFIAARTKVKKFESLSLLFKRKQSPEGDLWITLFPLKIILIHHDGTK
jgi:hypothetical protein